LGQIGPPIVGSYDHRLVALSICIAMSASYASLDLGGRVSAARGWVRWAWLAGGATTMGIGIWSMHFTGMLAFDLPVPVAYHWPSVLLSLLIAILASAVALYVVCGKRMGRVDALSGSALMGFGIVGMHYIGMAAMRLPASCRYNPLLVAASVLIAVIASLIAIIFAFDYREDFRGTTLAKVVSAAVMGAAISAMHYTGMAAAIFTSSAVAPDMSHAVSISSVGLSGIAIGTLVVQGAAILTSALDRRFATKAQELQTSERFRQIAEILRDVLLLCNADLSEVLFVNRAYEAIWGRTVESLYTDPRSWLEAVHPDDRQPVQEAVQRLADGEPLDNLEYRVVRPDGSISWVRWRAYPIRDTRGGAYRIVGSVHEFTMRKRVEEALKTSEREQRRIAEQLEGERARLVEAQEVANIGSWEAELQSLNVIWSEQTHRIFETDPSRFHPTRPKFCEFIHPEDRTKVDAAFLASLAKPSPCMVEYRIVMPDGRVKFIEERWKAFHDEQGKPVRVAGTCRDITERVRTEEELRRLSGQLLRLQDEERRRISRDLHDSTGQDLFAMAMMLGQAHDLIPSGKRKLRGLISECKALADRCIRDVRTLSYLLHPPALDETGLGGAIREYVGGFAKRSGIRVELEISPRLGRMTRDVELTLFRIVQESLTNIQRHSGSQQAKVRIHCNSNLELEISDRGHGISVSRQRREMEHRFEIGVGIPSMEERVKLIGGRLDIESTSQGTTVRVTIAFQGSEHEETSNPNS
jgi:PAS domain S-box-containing protein